MRVLRQRSIVILIQDDFCPSIYINWGVGCTTGMITDGEVHFEKGTSYTTGHIIETWEDLEKFRFDPDNRWIGRALEFWRGVETQELEGLVFTPILYRSHLDLANDLRGNLLFTDLYDEPEMVDVLLDVCSDCLKKLDGIFRQEIRALREMQGGIWGTVLPPGVIFLNGDPIDLISEEMVGRYNNPWIRQKAYPK
jgi:hypothetical protein